MVVLPAPVWPTMATVSPGSMVKETSRSTQSYSRREIRRCRAASLQLLALAGGFFGGLRQGAIGEPDVVELDAARPFRRLGLSGRDDLGRRVEQLEDALARGHGRLQDVVLLAQVLDGPEEALRILHEGHQHAEVTSLPNDLPPPNQMTLAMAIADSTSTTG